jgi:hypothetical protein
VLGNDGLPLGRAQQVELGAVVNAMPHGLALSPLVPHVFANAHTDARTLTAAVASDPGVRVYLGHLLAGQRQRTLLADRLNELIKSHVLKLLNWLGQNSRGLWLRVPAKRTQSRSRAASSALEIMPFHELMAPAMPSSK